MSYDSAAAAPATAAPPDWLAITMPELAIASRSSGNDRTPVRRGQRRGEPRPDGRHVSTVRSSGSAPPLLGSLPRQAGACGAGRQEDTCGGTTKSRLSDAAQGDSIVGRADRPRRRPRRRPLTDCGSRNADWTTSPRQRRVNLGLCICRCGLPVRRTACRLGLLTARAPGQAAGPGPAGMAGEP